jgi:sulfite exporter TauE/SafE
MPAYLAGAFVAGLLGSAHCLGMCGGFATACTRARGGLPAWHAGRIGTYVFLGALAGAAGALVPGPAWLPATIAALLMVWFALALAGLVPEPRLVPPGLARLATRVAGTPSLGSQFLFGVANGFLPCGLVYSALGIAVAAGTPVGGALAMAAFGLGTAPALTLAAHGLRRLTMASLWRRRAIAALILTSGLWTIWVRAGNSREAPHHHQAAPVPSAQEASPRTVEP